jgi:FkbM family methyltransferase
MKIDLKSIIKNLPVFYRKYRGFWKIYLLRLNLIDWPVKLGKRGKNISVYMRESDKPTFEEFYFEDGYQDIELEGYDLFFDVGSHIGLFSLMASESVERVISYEPDKNTFDILMKNIEINERNNIEACPYAVDKNKGTKEIQKTNNSAANSIEIDRKSKNTEVVKTITLEEMISNISENDKVFLKLDCEGSEFPILEDATPDQLRKFDTIFLEYHTDAGNPEKLRKILEDAGFKLKEREDPRDKEFENLGFYLANLD